MIFPRKKFIGGFFELALPTITEKNIVQHWQLPTTPSLCFSNARSALAHLMGYLQPKRIWLPAYVCPSLVAAFCVCHLTIHYYTVGDTLEPDLQQLTKECHPGDLILGINYFGQPPSQSFLDFIQAHQDFIWIEDCAQAIDTGQATWGNWRLFSPRKVLGVADGGYIVAQDGTPLPASSCEMSDINAWLPALLRFEDIDEKNNLQWHLMNQHREQTMAVSETRMSRLSYELLHYLDALNIIQQRKKNYAVLYEKLAHLAFLPQSHLPFCPFGFPIRLKNPARDFLNQALINRGIFPAIHWPTLPSPIELFPKEHQLSKELLTLPCDQRYQESDMQYLANCVLDILEYEKNNDDASLCHA